MLHVFLLYAPQDFADDVQRMDRWVFEHVEAALDTQDFRNQVRGMKKVFDFNALTEFSLIACSHPLSRIPSGRRAWRVFVFASSGNG